MTGDMLKRLLEQQFDNPGPGAEGACSRCRSGFTYRYRSSAPRGRARRRRLDHDRRAPHRFRLDRVRVAASDFLVHGGNGYTVLSEGTDTVVWLSCSDIDALVDYFKARSPVAPGPAEPDRSDRLNGTYFTQDARHRAY